MNLSEYPLIVYIVKLFIVMSQQAPIYVFIESRHILNKGYRTQVSIAVFISELNKCCDCPTRGFYSAY
jgi:hypothetical protein